jgi:formylglycine-generating enzyme required for sulfatase activity
MKRWLAVHFALAVSTSIACGGDVAAPHAQWVLTVSTDARAPSFGDRIFVEILQADGTPCTGCERSFGVDASSRPLSFGIAAPADGQPLWARATLLFAADVQNGGVQSTSTNLSAIGRLPEASGVTGVSLALPMNCFGVAPDPVAHRTCDPNTRALIDAPTLGDDAPLAFGSWPPLVVRDCPGAAPDGMACVPGSAFLMGSETVVVAVKENLPVPTHVVRVSPFFMDRTEMSVGVFRGLLNSGALPKKDAPLEYDPNVSQPNNACTYRGLKSSSVDPMPVACVTYEAAADACAALGKRLPTEAEWEYAARNTTDNATYPWGEDPDVCAHAVVGRGQSNALTAANVYESADCRERGGATIAAGPVAVGTSADLSKLGIYDLGGNLGEWVADAFASYTSPCWTPVGASFLSDPQCTIADAAFTGDRSQRGGSWAADPIEAASALRLAADAGTQYLFVGFRCAQSAN